MAAKKTPAKAETAPAPAPVSGMSASFHAFVDGMQRQHKYEGMCRAISYAYNAKCITAAERDVAICFLIGAWNVTPPQAIDDIKVFDEAYVEVVEKHKMMRSSG